MTKEDQPDMRALGLFSKLCTMAQNLNREIERLETEDSNSRDILLAAAHAALCQIETSAEEVFRIDPHRISSYPLWAINARSERLLALFPDLPVKNVVLSPGEMRALLDHTPLHILELAADKGLQAGASIAEIFDALSERPELEDFVLRRLASAAAARNRRWNSALTSSVLKGINHPAFAAFLRIQVRHFPGETAAAFNEAVRADDLESATVLLLADCKLPTRIEIASPGPTVAALLEEVSSTHGRLNFIKRTGGLEAHIARRAQIREVA